MQLHKGMKPLLADEEIDDEDRDRCADKQRASACGGFYSHVYLIIVFIGRISQGFNVVIFSPTIMYLAENVNESVASIAAFFTARSLGFMLGGLIAGFFMKVRNPLMSTACVLMICCICIGLVPAATTLTFLIIIGVVNGTAYGYCEAVLQGSILNVFGERNSRTHIQVFHLAFSVGALVGPLVVKPFLEAASLVKKDDTKCPNRNITNELEMAVNEINSTTVKYSSTAWSGINPIAFVFFISAVFTGVVSISLLVAACVNITMKVKHHRMSQRVETETRLEENFKDVIFLFVLITLSFFFLMSSELAVGTFIYAIAVCSKLNFSTSNASLFTFVSTGGHFVGRVLGVLASLYLKPRFMVLTSALGVVLASVMFSLFGENLPFVSWTAVFFYSFFIGPLYSSLVSWISQLCNVSGKYIFVLNFGTGVGSMVAAPIAGILFDLNPFYVVYFSSGTAALMCLILLLLIIYASRRYNPAFHVVNSPSSSLETTKLIDNENSSLD